MNNLINKITNNLNEAFFKYNYDKTNKQMFKDNYIKDLEDNKENIITNKNSKYLDYKLVVIPKYLYFEYVNLTKNDALDLNKLFEFYIEHIDDVGTMLISHKYKNIFLKGEE